MKDKDKHYCDNIVCNHNNTKGLCCLFNPDNCKYRQLQKENAELKKENQKWKDGIALKDEEIGCIETDFNTFKSKAKELLKRWVELYKPKLEGYPITTIQEQTEQFISEVEK